MVVFVARVIALSFLGALLDIVYEFAANFKVTSTVEIESETLNI